jgi:hypothetical protein
MKFFYKNKSILKTVEIKMSYYSHKRCNDCSVDCFGCTVQWLCCMFTRKGNTDCLRKPGLSVQGLSRLLLFL